MLTITGIPAFNDNYIWCMADSNSGKALVVDPGQADPVLEHLQDNNLTLDAILVTHHHPDHVGGIKALQEQCHPLQIFGPADSPFRGSSHPVRPGDEVVWQELAFSVIAVPGHTLDHIAYYCDLDVEGRPVLFCGDTLFVCGCGRLFEGTAHQMRESLERLRALPDDAAVYCAHEYTLANLRYARSLLPDDDNLRQFEAECQARRDRHEPTVPSRLGDEKRLNPFLRWDDPVLVKAARDYAAANGLQADSDDAVFAAVRHGKDHF